ncbi:MAG: ABC transporter permease, partial [Candidatus Paceibacterales bacterium]
TVLVSSFSIMSVLFLLVTEKQKDVGILKALGAKKKQILGIFSTVGMTLGLIGIGSGTLLGLFICWLLKTFPIIKLPDIYYDTSFPIKVEPSMVIYIVVLGSLMTLLSALWPAIKISKTEPLKGIYKTE